MEKWDVYDKNRAKTGKVVLRKNTLQPGDYHLVVHVCVLNPAGQLLMQQRHDDKKGFGGLWDVSAAGSALSGENSAQAAERELFEELGCKINFDTIRPEFTINFLGGFDDFYVVIEDIAIEKLVLQKEEVQNVGWASKEEVFALQKKGLFIPYRRGLIEMVFSFLNGHGALSKFGGVAE
jgi:isopentenyldiphosphate isomerase